VFIHSFGTEFGACYSGFGLGRIYTRYRCFGHSFRTWAGAYQFSSSGGLGLGMVSGFGMGAFYRCS
jgi:hypothetical protein